jgi:hypothetical protein
MAEFALRLPIFIASPSDVSAERDAVADAIRSLAIDAAKERLLLDPIRWEYDARPGVGRPQSQIRDKLLERSELVIVIFGERLGSAASQGSSETATQEELRVAMELVGKGKADDVFLYFKRRDGAAETPVSAFESQLQSSKKLFTWDFKDASELATLVSHHIGQWLTTWERVPDVCHAMLTDVSPESENLGENLLRRLAPGRLLRQNPLPFLGSVAVDLYQELGPEGSRRAFQLPASDHLAIKRFRTEHAVTPVVEAPAPKLTFSSHSWFQYYCARGLIDAILGDSWSAVENVPYENGVHQYLAALAPEHTQDLATVLVHWLNGANGKTVSRPIVRNFAAYVLGMIGAVDAQDDLARAFQDDDGEGVRQYCVTSLGKLRSRRHLALLVEHYDRGGDFGLRGLLGQAICRIVGIARFEL